MSGGAEPPGGIEEESGIDPGNGDSDMASASPVKFVHEGAAIDYTPVADTAAGTVVVQADLVGVTRIDLKAGQLGSLAVTGVFDFPKAGGVSSAIPVGTLTYWDAANSVATKNAAAGANKLIGKTVKTTVDADTIVRVRLQQ